MRWRVEVEVEGQRLVSLLIAKGLDVSEPTSRCRARSIGGTYCSYCDLFVGLDGLPVTAVRREPELLTVTIESAPVPAGCPACGVAAQVHSRRVVRLVDAPCFDTPQENLTDKQRARIAPAFAAGEAHGEVDLAWQGAQELRSAYRHPDKETGRTIAERIINSFPTCPVPEIARLGRTLRAWKEAFLAYFDTTATNGGTEAINVLIELHRRIDRGLTNFENYRLRMLLIGGGLNL